MCSAACCSSLCHRLCHRPECLNPGAPSLASYLLPCPAAVGGGDRAACGARPPQLGPLPAPRGGRGSGSRQGHRGRRGRCSQPHAAQPARGGSRGHGEASGAQAAGHKLATSALCALPRPHRLLSCPAVHLPSQPIVPCHPSHHPQVNLARGDPVRPILCRTPDGKLKPMHELDVVLM